LKKCAQHALAPDAAPLRFAPQVKRESLARLGGKGENSRCARARCASTHGPDALGKAVVGLSRRVDGDVGGWPHDHSRGHGSHAGTRRFPMGR